MCGNSKDCPMACTCFRAMAIPDEYQSYADFCSTDAECDHYWEVTIKEKLDELNKTWN